MINFINLIPRLLLVGVVDENVLFRRRVDEAGIQVLVLWLLTGAGCQLPAVGLLATAEDDARDLDIARGGRLIGPFDGPVKELNGEKGEF